MSAPILTASAYGRALLCKASATLPQVRSPASDAAERGTALHAYLQRALAVGVETAREEVPALYREECEDLDPRAILGPGTWFAEVALSYNPETGEASFHGINETERNYAGVLPGEVAGTVDALNLEGDAIHVVDWKTGRVRLGPAAEHAQLRLYALMAARFYGVDTVRVSLVYLQEGEAPYIDTATLDVFDLDAAAAELAQLVRTVHEARTAYRERGVMPDTTQGEHCKHCPAWASCPGYGAMLRRAAGEPEAVAGELARELTPAMAGLAWAKIKAFKAVIGHAESALYALASQVPIPLQGGLVLGVVESEREELDGAAVRRLVAERYGQETADAAVEWSATKTALKAALRPHAARGQLAALERQVLEELRAAGAVTRRVTSSIREHRPRPAEEPPALTDGDALGK